MEFSRQRLKNNLGRPPLVRHGTGILRARAILYNFFVDRFVAGFTVGAVK